MRSVLFENLVSGAAQFVPALTQSTTEGEFAAKLAIVIVSVFELGIRCQEKDPEAATELRTYLTDVVRKNQIRKLTIDDALADLLQDHTEGETNDPAE